MKVKALHWNPGTGKTACGRELAKVQWRSDLKDCTCDSCQRVARSIEAVGKP